MGLDRRTFVTATGIALGAASASAAPTSDNASPATQQWHRYTNLMPAPLDATWRAWTDPAARVVWWGYATDALKDAAEAVPMKSIRTVVNHPGLPGITTQVVTFEAAPGGTLVTNAFTGFGDGAVWESALQSTAHGVHEMMGDLALYLRTGAGFPRHVRLRARDLLRGTREVAGGVEVYEVTKDTLAAEIGLRPGDIVVSMAGAGVYNFAGVHFACRAFGPGDPMEVKWVRDGRLMTATGKLTSTATLRKT